MTNKNNFFYYEEAEVFQVKGGMYRINLEDEECTFYIKPGLPKKISIATDVDEELIVILLAYIDYVRKHRKVHDAKRQANRIEDQRLFEGIKELLGKYSIEALIELLKSLKWHEILDIFNSSNPLQEIEEFI